MRQRGRQSAASLSVVASSEASVTELPTFAAAPDDFDDTKRARWDAIVREWPLDHWRSSDLDLLRSLVLTEAYVRDCEETIAREGTTVATTHGGIQGHPAVMHRRMHLATIAALQRTLRLCPSSRYQRNGKEFNKQVAERVKKPWEAGR